MHLFEILLLLAGAAVGLAGLNALRKARRAAKTFSVRRFDDLR